MLNRLFLRAEKCRLNKQYELGDGYAEQITDIGLIACRRTPKQSRQNPARPFIYQTTFELNAKRIARSRLEILLAN